MNDNQENSTPTAISELCTSVRWRKTIAYQATPRVYDKDSGQWFAWDVGGLWRPSSELIMREHVAALAQLIAASADELPAADKLSKAQARWERYGTVQGAMSFSKAYLSVRGSAYFDRQPDLIALSDGQIINLRSGAIRPGTPADQIALSLADGVKPETVSPTRWLKFIDELLGVYPENDRAEIADWMQRAVGYSFTGRMEAEILPFMYGPPGTGKSTFIETLSWLAGKHHCGLPADALAAGLPSHRQWLARLQGRRLATLTETAADAAWRSSEVSSIVSGELVTANFMRQNSFEFEPTCTVWIAGNHQPKCDSGSGLFRRLRVINCARKPTDEEKDESLKQTFRTAEAGGILQWVLDGAVEYFKRGLRDTPAAIRAATAEYQESQDAASDFFLECLEYDKAYEETATAIYIAHCAWADSEGWRKPWSRSHLGKELGRRGFVRYRQQGKGATTWRGLKLK